MSRGPDLFGTTFERGDRIFRQGDPGDRMYLVQSGAVEIVRRTAADSTVIALLEAGECFGEMALLVDRPRATDAVAAMRTRLVPFTRTSLLERLGKDPAVAMHLLRVFCRRIEDTNRRQSREGLSDDATRSGVVARAAGGAGAPDDPGTQPALEFLAGLDETDRLPEGTTVFRQGEPGDALYVVLEGQVALYDETSSGRYRIASLGAGDFFGEMALITDRPRSATALAATDARLLRVPRETFLDRIAAQPRFGLAILQTLVVRLRRTLDGEPAAAPASASVAPAAPPVKAQGRIRIGFVALSACAGCTAVLLEEPARLTDLLGRASIEYSSLLMDRQEIGEIDLCVVEGLVRMESDLARLREARARSRFLIAWGTCAAWGGIPSLANRHEIEDLLEAAYGGTDDLFSHYFSGDRATGGGVSGEDMAGLLRRAGSVGDHVRVDWLVPGCPPPARQLDAILRSMEGRPAAAGAMPNICAECPRKPGGGNPEEVRMFPRRGTDAGQCLLTQGTYCLGPVSRGGCAAACTKGGLPCWGCRGPSDAVLQKIPQGESFEAAALAAAARRAKVGAERFEPFVKALRIRAGSLLGFAPAVFGGPERMR